MQKRIVPRRQQLPLPNPEKGRTKNLQELLGPTICALTTEENIRLNTIRVVAQLRHENEEIRRDSFQRLRETIAWLAETENSEHLRAFRKGLSQGSMRWIDDTTPEAAGFSHLTVRKIAKDTEKEIKKLGKKS